MVQDGYYRVGAEGVMIYVRRDGKWFSMLDRSGKGLVPHSEDLDQFIRDRGLHPVKIDWPLK